MHAKVIRDNKFVQKRQPLSGYVMGWERQIVWRLHIVVGNDTFLSHKVYASEASAKRAANRMKKNDD